MLFHFQARTESHILLSDASQLSSLEEARVEAARRVGELLQTHARQIWADQHWHMDVTDEVGLILFSLRNLGHAVGGDPQLGAAKLS